jgi:hypothetical protein
MTCMYCWLFLRIWWGKAWCRSSILMQ